MVAEPAKCAHNAGNLFPAPRMTAHAARDLGLTLRTLVADLDPMRWKDTRREQLRAAFAEYREDIETVLGDWSSEGSLEAVHAKLEQVRGVVVDNLPSADDVKARWMEFRDEIHPAYEELAEALKSAHVELPSVRPTNYWRSTFHVLGAVLAMLFVEYAPWTAVIVIPLVVATFFWFLEIMRRVSKPWNDFLMKLTDKINHPHERYRVNSSTWFATALFLLSLTYEPIAGAAAVLVLGFGDPIAGLVGRRWGRTKLVNGRSLEGTLAFAVISFLVVMAMFALWHGDVSTQTVLIVSAVAAISGAVTELFSRRVDDNFAIPMVVGALVWATLGVIG